MYFIKRKAENNEENRASDGLNQTAGHGCNKCCAECAENNILGKEVADA